MRIIGFRKDHDFEIIRNELIEGSQEVNKEDLDDFTQKKILTYLENGIVIFGITLWLYDGNESIGPYMIRTDGEWIWPNHFAFYLKKNNFSSLNKEFLDYIKAKDFMIEKLDDNKMKVITKYFESTVLKV